jgi:hypothetical protein
VHGEWKLKISERYNNYINKKLDPNYDFKRLYYLLIIIYLFSTLFDFCLTFLTYSFTPSHFFAHELSPIIKYTFAGSFTYYLILIVATILPLIYPYYEYKRDMQKKGYLTNRCRIAFYILWFVSWGHMFGGLTNFIYLVNLSLRLGL